MKKPQLLGNYWGFTFEKKSILQVDGFAKRYFDSMFNCHDPIYKCYNPKYWADEPISTYGNNK